MEDLTTIDTNTLDTVTGGYRARLPNGEINGQLVGGPARPALHPSWEQTLNIFKSLRPGKPVIPQGMQDRMLNWNRLRRD